jgi:putative transposase
LVQLTGHAKGAIERWHRTWRDEVGDELGAAPRPLAELNSIHWAWLASEYHRRRHETTGRAPLEHWLEQARQLRPLPPDKDLDQVFLHRLLRKVRQDGTVRFAGRFYEVRPELVGQTVQLRFDPHEPHGAPPKVFRDDRFYCDSVPLDRLANNLRRRQRPPDQPDPAVVPTGLDPLALIQQEHYQRTQLPGLDHLTDAAED